MEKDIWLRRALEGHKILLPQDVAVHKTTMTYGDDVARAISLLIGNEKAKAEAVHLTSTEPMTWKTVLKIYTDVIETKFGVSPEIWMPETSDVIADAIGNKYQIRYDRMFDRVFDNSKCWNYAEKILRSFRWKSVSGNALKNSWFLRAGSMSIQRGLQGWIVLKNALIR